MTTQEYMFAVDDERRDGGWEAFVDFVVGAIAIRQHNLMVD